MESLTKEREEMVARIMEIYCRRNMPPDKARVTALNILKIYEWDLDLAMRNICPEEFRPKDVLIADKRDV